MQDIIELEKTLPNGETITLTSVWSGYAVDCWDKDTNNRWHKQYAELASAQREYDRWN